MSGRAERWLTMTVGDWISDKFFRAVHGLNLVYTACWEDPRTDRAAMELGPSDTVLVITSAGCNALDYALDSPRWIYAVDINFRQNALLELKQAAIRELDYDTFFAMFGHGYLPDVRIVYRKRLRSALSARAVSYWDRAIGMFANRHRPFYFYGTSGTFAWMLSAYIRRVASLGEPLDRMLRATSTREQWFIYKNELRDRFWTPWIRWGLANPAMLAISGVPRPQILLARRAEQNIAGHLQRCAEYCIAQQPLADNYFWRLYLKGSFTPECCPEYLKLDNFTRLRNGLVDRISTHTACVTSFLRENEVQISRFVLLDHFDWFYGRHGEQLQAEWQAIIDRAAPATRLVWRSMGRDADFVNRVRVTVDGRDRLVGDLLEYEEQLSERLFADERTRTYQSLRIAGLTR